MERSCLAIKTFKTRSSPVAKMIKRTLTIMEILQIAGKEEEILGTAAELKITFYDASYAYFAKEKEA